VACRPCVSGRVECRCLLGSCFGAWVGWMMTRASPHSPLSLSHTHTSLASRFAIEPLAPPCLRTGGVARAGRKEFIKDISKQKKVWDLACGPGELQRARARARRFACLSEILAGTCPCEEGRHTNNDLREGHAASLCKVRVRPGGRTHSHTNTHARFGFKGKMSGGGGGTGGGRGRGGQ